jgi:Family of unknown function (DUF6288)
MMSDRKKKWFRRGGLLILIAACVLITSQSAWCAGEEEQPEQEQGNQPGGKTIFKGLDEAYLQNLHEKITSSKKTILILEAKTKRTKEETKELKALKGELPKMEELVVVIEKKKAGKEITRPELEMLKGASLTKGRAESRQKLLAARGADGQVDYTKGLGPEGGWRFARLGFGPDAIDLGFGAGTINLGSLGACGYVPLDEPRLQILVDWVFAGSPADGKPKPATGKLTSKSGVPVPVPVIDGKLMRHDVILGIISPKVDGIGKDGNFCDEANHVLAKAIEVAEEKGGEIVFKVWRPKTVSTNRTVVVSPNAVYNVEPTTPPAGAQPGGDKEGGKEDAAPAKDDGKDDAEPVEKVASEASSVTSVELAKPATTNKPEVFKVSDLAVVQPVSGAVVNVTVTFPRMGAYSETSPWDCKKTDKLIDMAAQSIVESQDFGSDFGSIIAGLGLLATGEAKYLPKVREFAHSLIPQGVKHDHERLDDGASTWHTAYQLVLLSEYYLATKDEAVLPAIRGNALVMSKGISGTGIWGHGTGALYGPAQGYGGMCQASLPTAIGLVLAQKCGIKNHYIDKAVEMALDCYPYYVDRGVIPYGDGVAQRDGDHDCNGRNSIAAVLYDIAGRKREADYFTRMTLMSHAEREGGHTGHFFAWTWGALGAARGGPEAAHMFTKNTRYWTELCLRPDGSSIYQPVLKGDPGKYKNWCTSGAMLMQYCLPRKALYITGKGGSVVPPIGGDDLKMLEDAGRLSKEAIAKASDDQLLGYLSHYSPLVRERAGIEIGKRQLNVVDKLLNMLKSGNRYARYGACQGLRYIGKTSQAAVHETLVKIIETDDDLIMRHYAVVAMHTPDAPKDLTPGLLGLPPATYAARLLNVINGPVFSDPSNYQDKRHVQGEIAKVLFERSGALGKGEGLGTVDHQVLISTLKKFMLNPEGQIRDYSATTMQFLGKEDMAQLWGALYYGMTNQPISGTCQQIHRVGNGLMADNHIKEGLPLVIHWIFEKKGWGNKARKETVGRVTAYGKLLEPYLKELEPFTFLKGVPEAIEKIKATPAPPLVSIEPQIKAFEAEAAAAKNKKSQQ